MDRNVLYLSSRSAVTKPVELALAKSSQSSLSLVLVEAKELERHVAARSPTNELPLLIYNDRLFPGAFTCTMFVAELLDLIPFFQGEPYAAWLSVIELCLDILDSAHDSDSPVSSSSVEQALQSIEKLLVPIEEAEGMNTETSMADICVWVLSRQTIDIDIPTLFPRSAKAAARGSGWCCSASRSQSKQRFPWLWLGGLCTAPTC